MEILRMSLPSTYICNYFESKTFLGGRYCTVDFLNHCMQSYFNVGFQLYHRLYFPGDHLIFRASFLQLEIIRWYHHPPVWG